MSRWYTEPAGDVREQAQVVIIGAGAGGAFTALTLAEAGLDVVLLEDGHAYRHEPLGLGEATGQMYAEAGFRTTQGTPPIPIAGGRALGGSTVVNSALCFRPPPGRIQEWNDQSGGAYGDEAAFYRIVDDIETLLHVAETPDALLSGNDRVHQRGARALGWAEGNLRRNTPACAGCGRCNQGCTVKGKFSVDLEILPRAARAGARIYTGCKVVRIGKRGVYGAVTNRAGEDLGRLHIKAQTRVLCGGAISTPTLLLDSNLAEPDGEVGYGLQCQPVINAMGFFGGERVFSPGSTQGHWIKEFLDDDIVIEANPMVASLLAAMPYNGQDAHKMLGQGYSWTTSGALIRDRTRGRVARSWRGAARIHYDLVQEDYHRAMRGLRHLLQLFLDGAGAELAMPGVFASSPVRTMAEADAFLSDFPLERVLLYASHPQATCSLGRATDEKGEVLGAPGVFCADASVLPSNVGRNPQISVMSSARMVAERIATHLGGQVQPLLQAPPPDQPSEPGPEAPPTPG